MKNMKERRDYIQALISAHPEKEYNHTKIKKDLENVYDIKVTIQTVMNDLNHLGRTDLIYSNSAIKKDKRRQMIKEIVNIDTVKTLDDILNVLQKDYDMKISEATLRSDMKALNIVVYKKHIHKINGTTDDATIQTGGIPTDTNDTGVSRRQRAIMEILMQHKNASQQDIKTLLKKNYNINVTQATISRDLNKMRDILQSVHEDESVLKESTRHKTILMVLNQHSIYDIDALQKELRTTLTVTIPTSVLKDDLTKLKVLCTDNQRFITESQFNFYANNLFDVYGYITPVRENFVMFMNDLKLYYGINLNYDEAEFHFVKICEKRYAEFEYNQSNKVQHLNHSRYQQKKVTSRHEQIIVLIEKYHITSQEQLKDYLEKEYDVKITQGTLSRDVQKLQLVYSNGTLCTYRSYFERFYNDDELLTPLQKIIYNIIDSHEVQNQKELLNLVKEQGYHTTQATISRTLARLNVTRRVDDDGNMHYVNMNTIHDEVIR